MFNPGENYEEDVIHYADEEEMLSEMAHEQMAVETKEVDLLIKTTFLSRHALRGVRMSVEPPSLSEVVLKNEGNWDWVFRTFGQARNNRKVCDPNWFSGPECDSVLSDIDTICNQEPKCGYDKTARNGVVMATNAPIVTALNTFPVTHVLVCGMDHQGADLKRIQLAAQHHNLDNIIVDVVDANAERTKPGWPQLPGVSVRCVVSDFSLLIDALDGRRINPRYDFIMMNHTFPSFMTRDFPWVMKIMEMTAQLGVKTRLVGTYWDPHTMIVSNYCGYDPITRSFSFDGQVVLEGVCYNKFTMLGKRYVDPVMDIAKVRYEVNRKAFTFDQWHASRFVQRYEGVRPDVFKKVKLLSGLRVVVICNFDTGKGSFYNPPQLPGAKLYKVDSNLRLVSNFVSEASFPVRKNKGRHFSGRDALYTGYDIAVAPKVDGVHAQMTMRENMVAVVTNLGSFQLMMPFKVEGVHYLEGELLIKNWHKVDLLGDPVRKFFNYVSSNMYDIVIFDGLAAGSHQTSSFIDRWSAICQLFTVSEGLSGFFTLQGYVFYPSAEEVGDTYSRSSEGIVIQPVSSPAGAFGDGFGSARYVKKRITYEDFNGTTNEIWEFDLTNKPVRRRPDRVVPSTVAELALIREFWTFDEFIIYYRAMRNVVMGKNHRFPALRGSGDYVRALEQGMFGDKTDDVIEDVFLAYMDYYSGQGVVTGSIQNVATLIQAVDKVRTKVVHSLEFSKFVGTKLDAADRFLALLKAKTTIPPGCSICAVAAGVFKTLTVDVRPAYVTIEGKNIRNPNVYTLNEYIKCDLTKYDGYVVFESDALKDMLGGGDRKYPDHWFLLRGDNLRHGNSLHHIRPLGEIKRMVTVGELPPQEVSLYNSLDFYEVEIDFHRKGAAYVSPPCRISFVTANVLLDKREAETMTNRPWMVPLLPFHSVNLRTVRCLADIIRSCVRSGGYEVIVGL